MRVKQCVGIARADTYQQIYLLYAELCFRVKRGYRKPLKYFGELRDPRAERNREHLLEEVLLSAIAAGLSDATSWNDIAEYGGNKLG